MRRKQQQQNFFIALGVVAAAGVAVWFGVHTYLNGQFEEQQERNKFLTEEIAKLDKQIAEIAKVKEQTAALLARAKVVETLQATRAEVVHLMDQLVRQLPDGVYLKAINQNGQKVTITGFTQSGAGIDPDAQSRFIAQPPVRPDRDQGDAAGQVSASTSSR